VPNKSTMVEDDDDAVDTNDDEDGDAFGLESAARSRESKRSIGGAKDTMGSDVRNLEALLG